MTAAALKRKGVQVEPAVHTELLRRKLLKENALLASEHPRDVSYSEVIADALGLMKK
jgi:hypothetical protein